MSNLTIEKVEEKTNFAFTTKGTKRTEKKGFLVIDGPLIVHGGDVDFNGKSIICNSFIMNESRKVRGLNKLISLGSIKAHCIEAKQIVANSIDVTELKADVVSSPTITAKYLLCAIANTRNITIKEGGEPFKGKEQVLFSLKEAVTNTFNEITNVPRKLIDVITAEPILTYKSNDIELALDLERRY